MAIEVFQNDPTTTGSSWSTLSGNGGSITSGATSLKVASNTPYGAADPTATPATKLRVRIGNEIILVTDNRTTTWTVIRAQEGSTGASHNDGDTVTEVLTKGSYQELATVRGLFFVTDYGAVADLVGRSDGAMTSGSATLTAAGASFTTADVGKTIIVSMGSGHTPLATTISARTSATQVTLAANATQTVSSAVFYYGTDDTTAIQAAINAAPAGATVVLHPTSKSLTTAALTVSKNLNIQGADCQPIYQSANVAGGTLSTPTVLPYFNGSGIVVAATGVNGITISGIATTANLRNFCIIFGGQFNSTGDGVNYIPPALSTGYDNGLMHARWDNVHVFGHDGSHYAFKIANTLYCTFTNIRGYGGGGFYHEQNSAPSVNGHYGNLVLIHPFFDVFVFATTAIHAYYLKVTASTLNLITMIRPQCLGEDRSTQFPAAGANGITTTSRPLVDEGCQYLTLIADDFEGRNGDNSTFSSAVGFARIGSYSAGHTAQTVQLRPYNSAQLLQDLSRGNPDTYATQASRPDPSLYGIGGGSIIDTSTGVPIPIFSDMTFGFGGVGGDWRKSDGSVSYIAGTAGGAGTTPGSVAGGPLNWWDASALGLAVGASVSSVSSTGSGANALSCTGVKYAPGVVNGLGALRFDGGGSTRATVAFTLNQPLTLFLVVRQLYSDTTDGGHAVVGDGSTADVQMILFQGGVEIWAGGTTLKYTSPKAQRNWDIITYQVNAGTSVIRAGGAQIAAAGGTSVGSNNAGGITLGNARSGTGRSVRVDIAEAIVYNSALNSTDMLSVERWLGTKYAITTA